MTTAASPSATAMARTEHQPAVCGDTLWSTGEQLRNARDPAIVARLQRGGPLIVNGLQGNARSLCGRRTNRRSNPISSITTTVSTIPPQEVTSET